MATVQLGDKVKDTITGGEGIAIGITDWMYGCRRVVIQPQELKDGKPVDTFTVDEPACEILEAKKAPATPNSGRHGPREDDVLRRDSALRR